MKTLMKIFAVAILIGIVGVAFNKAFGANTITYLTEHQIPGTTDGFYWTFNFNDYFKTLETSVTNVAILELKIPDKQPNLDIIHNMMMLVDYLIFLINIVIYPMRIGAYLIKNVLILFGVNGDINDPLNGLAWLINLINTLINNMQIPFTP